MTFIAQYTFTPRPVRTFIRAFTDRLAALASRRLAPIRRESRRALQRRQGLVRQVHYELGHSDWQVIIPQRVNAPAFLLTPQGRYRILIRTVRPGVVPMGLSLTHALAADDLGYVVVWLDPLWGCAHAVFLPTVEVTPYQRFTSAQIIARAARTFPIPV